MLDAALLEEDRRARESALDTTRSFIVQAPAGSGKTELLIQRYLRLLARVDAPEEVLAITFTRKAAAEMLTRVLGALDEASRPEGELAPHEKVTRTAAEAVLQRDTELGWNLKTHSGRLRIQTLDSLNASIARMLPVTAAANVAGSTVADEAQTKALYRQAAVASLEWLNSDSDYAGAISTVLAHLDNNTDLYVAYLSDMLGVRDQWLPFIGSGQLNDEEFDDLRRKLENDLRAIREEHVLATLEHATPEQLEALATLLRAAAENLEAENKTEDTIRYAGDNRLTVEWWLGIARMLLKKGGEWRVKLDVRDGFPPHAKPLKRQAFDLMDEFERRPMFRTLLHGMRELPPCGYTDSQWAVLVALIRLLPLAVYELQNLFTRRAMTDFVEIARAADAALGTTEQPSDIALLLDYQVRHILVDEMQDTSLTQYEMIRALTRGWQPGEGRTLFCVGDPMQSIYRFRNAEVAQFISARRDGIGEVQLHELILRQNFRSGEYLVDWFNRVFPLVLAPEDDPLTSAVSYASAVAAAQHRGNGEVTIHPSLGKGRQHEADVGLEVIRRLLAEHPGESIAVLVRGRGVLPELLARLRHEGIGYEAIDIDRLTDLPEVIEVLALVRAAVHPADRLAWLALLRSPWIGLDWTDLHAVVVNDTGSSIWELLHADERLAALSPRGRAAIQQALPALAMLRSPRRYESLRSIVERAWLMLGGPTIPDAPEAIDNIYRLLEVIGRLEQAGTLDDVAELEAELDLERVSSVKRGQLSIMTMHKAKGLQYDHVVLYGLGRLPRAPRGDVLSWFELPPNEDRTRKVLSPIGPRATVEKDPIHTFIGGITKARDRFETGRLLYVACTRAKQSLHLVGHTRVDGDEVKRPDPRSLLYLLWPFAEPVFEAALAAEGAPPEESDEVWVEPVLRRFAEPWVVPAAPRVPAAVGARVSGSETVEYDWAGSDVRFAGTLVHRWLQRVADGRAGLEDYSSPESARLFTRWLIEAGASEASHVAVLDRVTRALDEMASDERGRWLVAGEGSAEMSLTGVVDGELVTGVIDRVRIDDGEHWLVDYKTSSHEGGDLDGFLAAETERYRGQLRRYKTLYEAWNGKAPRCALYFPLLARFVEVDVGD